MARSAMVATLLMGVLLASQAFAVPVGKTVDWDTPMGKVTFDGKVHADAGLKCTNCHSKIFKMKKGTAEMKMADINAGKFCGECHNGGKSFKTNDPANCTHCHKK